MSSSIFKKFAMALTGLIWFGFLIGHLSGNFLIMKSAEAFNAYSAFLNSLGGLLILVELALLFFFVVHFVTGIQVTKQNRAARKKGYEVNKTAGEATLFSRTMAIGGVIILLFVPTHVYWFKFAHDHTNLWAWVMETFKNPLAVGWYVIAMLAVGMHLSHGFGSAFQTLGIIKPHWRVKLKSAGVAIGWIIALGFISLPVWAFVSQQS